MNRPPGTLASSQVATARTFSPKAHSRSVQPPPAAPAADRRRITSGPGVQLETARSGVSPSTFTEAVAIIRIVVDLPAPFASPQLCPGRAEENPLK